MNAQDLATLDRLISPPTNPQAPDRIYGWKSGHLSIARFGGGCTVNDVEYVIDMAGKDQPLVRWDVLVAEARAAKAAAKEKTGVDKSTQGDLL
jgi:hypothetical protein